MASPIDRNCKISMLTSPVSSNGQKVAAQVRLCVQHSLIGPALQMLHGRPLRVDVASGRRGEPLLLFNHTAIGDNDYHWSYFEHN